METEELLVTLSWLANRSLNQTNFLFDLCDKDFDKLLKYEAYKKRTMTYGCVGDKESLDEALTAWEKLRENDKNKNKNGS